MIKLRQIEVLHAILSTGSVTAAANALHVSQPAVSKILKQAERQLGFRLFAREANRLRATEEALALYREIEKIFPQIDAVQRLAENLRHGVGKTLRIVALPSLAQSLLPTALAVFRSAQPALDIELRTRHTQELVNSLILRDADLGFDFGGFDHPAIECKTLLTAEYVCVTPVGWFDPGKELTAGDLSGRPRIRMTFADALTRRLAERDTRIFAEIPSSLAVQNYHAALEMVGRGLGFALIDSFTALAKSRGDISMHRLDPKLAMPLNCLTLHNRPASALDEELAAIMARTGEAVLASARF
ncbi:MAG: LysR family transcriptional regulator [Azoarcus sp.]|jgi:DNA-binding transcriptional LysR family regulator|nr:LysR family transcriptional regulator [Azoarcus sp.]